MIWIKNIFLLIYNLLTFLSWVLLYPIFLLCWMLLPILKFFFPISIFSSESKHLLKDFFHMNFNEQRQECFLWFLCVLILACVISIFVYFFFLEEEFPNPLIVIALWIIIGVILKYFTNVGKK